MELNANSKIGSGMEYNDETKFFLEAELLERTQLTKRKISELPLEVQNKIEAAIDANIIYNSEAMEEDTLPKGKAIPLLMKNARKRNGALFRL